MTPAQAAARRRRKRPPSAMLAAANEQRSAAAASRDVLICAAALQHGLPQNFRAVAQARTRLPGATLAELAADIGATKDQVAAIMRRIRISCSAGDRRG